MGLIDSDDVYSCIQHMRTAESDCAADEPPKFLFAQQMLQSRKAAPGGV